MRALGSLWVPGRSSPPCWLIHQVSNVYLVQKRRVEMAACRGPRISCGWAWGSSAQPVVISGWAPQVHSVFAPQVSALRHLAHRSAQYLNQLHGPGLLGSRPAWWRGHTGATLPPGLSPRSLMPSCLPGPTKHGPSLGNKLTVAYSPAPGPGVHLLSSLTTVAPQCPELKSPCPSMAFETCTVGQACPL